MTLLLTEPQRKSKAQFRYLRERVGIGLTELGRHVDATKCKVGQWEYRNYTSFPPMYAWDYLLGQADLQREWVMQQDEQIEKSGQDRAIIELYRYDKHLENSTESDGEQSYNYQHFNARAIELATELSFRNYDIRFVFAENPGQMSEDKPVKAQFFGIRKWCRIERNLILKEFGYKKNERIRRWESPISRDTVPEKVFKWACSRLENRFIRVDAALERFSENLFSYSGDSNRSYSVTLPYYITQKQFEEFRNDKISFSEINAMNTEIAMRLEEQGYEVIFKYPEDCSQFSIDAAMLINKEAQEKVAQSGL